jgi:hypothetical protein
MEHRDHMYNTVQAVAKIDGIMIRAVVTNSRFDAQPYNFLHLHTQRCDSSE